MSETTPPEGWSATTLGALGRYLNGRAFKKAEWSKAGRPIIRIQDLTGSNDNPNFFEGEVEDRYIVRPGDLLISWSATLGAYIWDGPEGVLNQHIFKVESKIDRSFHYHLVRESLAELSRGAHGSGMVHVTKGTFDATPVVVPDDLAVQKALSGLIDHSEEMHAVAAESIERAALTIEQLRKSILVAACSGRLTQEWRTIHPDAPSVEHALAALADSKRKRRSNVSSIPEVALPELPETYLVATIGEASTLIEYGTSKKCNDDARGVPVLRMGNIRDDGTLRVDDLKYATSDTEIKKLTLQDGDFLFNRTNSPEKVGKAAVFHEPTNMSFASYLIRVRFDPDVADPDFVNLWVNSAWGKLWARQVKTDGVSQSNINGTKLAAMPLPLPPIDEQREIVSRASAMLQLADELEEHVSRASKAVERSAQAVLAKAFRGELTPADVPARIVSSRRVVVPIKS